MAVLGGSKEKGMRIQEYEMRASDFHSISDAYQTILPLICTRLCDEATSALDSTTESSILNSLMSLSVDRTSVFIAHRLTTAMLCDEIIVLENGTVVEQGPHDLLLSKHGRYAELWSQQNTTEGS